MGRAYRKGESGGAMSLETIESKLARVAARLQREREECEVCEARNERAAIRHYDGGLSVEEAEQLAKVEHPCRHL
jgi:hypothetical protein